MGVGVVGVVHDHRLGKYEVMPRAIWKGALNFGLVNVPVGLHPATKDRTVHFNQFESGTSDRIRYQKVNERTGREVSSEGIVKGLDVGGGEHVVLSDEELAAAEPRKSKLIEITDFVNLDQIDPVYFRSTYYLAPEGEAAKKAYGLLRQVMQTATKVAIGTLVMRNKEYPVAIRPNDEVLTLETMHFAEEVRSPSKDLPGLPGAVKLSDREVSMGKLLLESMQSDWDPDRYHDTYRKQVEAIAEQKRQGQEIVAETVTEPAKVVDLMEALNASIESVRSNRPNAGDKPPRPAERSPNKKGRPAKISAKKAAKGQGRQRAS